jgi:MFS superfamily sulfate permease-like transporter
MNVRGAARRLARSTGELLPNRSDYLGLSRTWRGDLFAGLTVGVVALPLALGFGVASGVGAAAETTSGVIAGIVAVIFGGSWFQVSGPTGAMAVILVPIVPHGARSSRPADDECPARHRVRPRCAAARSSRSITLRLKWAMSTSLAAIDPAS